MDLKEFTVAYTLEGDGIPFVLIHGYPLDHSIWDPIVPLLSKSYKVIVPDLRGFGASGSTSRVYSMNDYAGDLAEFLDGLMIDQAVLIGHSMGGYVALAFAKAYPARVRGLGLVSSQVLADAPDRKEGRYKSASDVSENGIGSVVEAMTPKFTSDTRLQAYARESMERQQPAAYIGALKAMAERRDSTPLLSSLRDGYASQGGAFHFPLVLIHGDSDMLIPIDRAREVKQALPQAYFVEISGAGHMPMMEAKEQTAEALKHLA